jgi:hypothetical protein
MKLRRSSALTATKKHHPPWSLLTRTLSPLAGLSQKKINDDGTWRSKARLVARGYEYKEKDRVSSDFPVASSASQRIVLALLSEKQWIPNS